MMNKLKNNEGITLIALVITIIVLLILAGIAISMLAGDNGILRQAAKAKNKTGEAQRNETVALDTYEDVINGTIEGIPVVTIPPTTAVTVKTKYKDTSAKNTATKTAVIPKGFKVSNIKEEQKIDDGLVVIAPDGSEFVWVPVDDISTMYETKTVTQVDGTQKEIKVGKLYNNGDINSPITWSDSGYREPAILKDTTYGDAVPESTDATKGIGLLKSIVKLSGTTDNEILGKWEIQLQNEFNEMINSVEGNGGFYVGRYECSLREESGEKIIQSVKGETSATAVSNSCNTWYGLYQKNKEYSKRNQKLTNIVGSNMIWGCQYDQMMIWMQKNGYKVNSKNSDDLKGAIKNITRTTGKENDKDVLNNVYDLLGCNIEWTLEVEVWAYRTWRRRWFQQRLRSSELS